MDTIGKNNALSDIEGLIVGNYTDMDAACGVTVVICKEGAVAGVDVRGSAPGTRDRSCCFKLYVESHHLRNSGSKKSVRYDRIS